MIGRNAFSMEVLAELGWTMLLYCYLEHHLTLFVSAFKDPDNPSASRDAVARLGLEAKLKGFRKAVLALSERHGVSSAGVDDLLNHIRAAVTPRDELVHGFVKLADDGKTPIAKRVHKDTAPHPVTIDELKATNNQLFAADNHLALFVVSFWNDVEEVRNVRNR